MKSARREYSENLTRPNLFEKINSRDIKKVNISTVLLYGKKWRTSTCVLEKVEAIYDSESSILRVDVETSHVQCKVRKHKERICNELTMTIIFLRIGMK